jgi:hypothetical protein
MHTQFRKHQKMSMDSWHMETFFGKSLKTLLTFTGINHLHKEMFEELNTMVGGSILHLCG